MQQSRYEWVDIAKAIGIFLVVLAHTYRGITHSGVKAINYLDVIDSIIYTFHMPLFFFISGAFFVSSISKRTDVEFVKNKLETILYPYVLWSLVQGLTIAYLSSKGIANQDIKYTQVLQIWKPVGVFWFLHNLFFITLFTGFIYRLNLLKYKWVLIFIAAFLYVLPTLTQDAFLPSILAKNWIFFLIGVFFRAHVELLEKTRWSLLWIGGIAILFMQIDFHCFLNLNYQRTGLLTLILGVACIYFVISLSYLLQGKVANWILNIGRQSMSIYLLHVFFASGARIVLSKILGINSLWFDLTLGTFLGMFFPLLIGTYIHNNHVNGFFSLNFNKLVGKNE